MTLLAIAIVWSTVANNVQHSDSSQDIDDLEAWQRQVEGKINWLKDDHDNWAEKLQDANPELSVPLTTQTPLPEEEADFVD